jgi:hypothetical protein
MRLSMWHPGIEVHGARMMRLRTRLARKPATSTTRCITCCSSSSSNGCSTSPRLQSTLQLTTRESSARGAIGDSCVCVCVCVCVYTYIGRRRLCNSVFNNKRCQKEAIQLSSHLALGRSPALLHTPPRCLEFEARPALSKPRKRNHNNNQ